MVEINLLKGACPTFNIKDSHGVNLRVLLDTGAFFSVWTKSEEELKYRFPDAIDTGCETIIKGFSAEDDRLQKSDICKVYKIPVLNIGDIVIRNFPIAVKNKASQVAYIVLSSYVFKNCEFSINFNARILSVNYDREIVCKELRTNLEDIKVRGFTVFSQEDFD